MQAEEGLGNRPEEDQEAAEAEEGGPWAPAERGAPQHPAVVGARCNRDRRRRGRGRHHHHHSRRQRHRREDCRPMDGHYLPEDEDGWEDRPQGHRLNHPEDDHWSPSRGERCSPSTVRTKRCPTSDGRGSNGTLPYGYFPRHGCRTAWRLGHRKNHSSGRSRNSRKPGGGSNRKKITGQGQTDGTSSANNNEGNWKNKRRHGPRNGGHFSVKWTKTAGRRNADGRTTNGDSGALNGETPSNNKWRNETPGTTTAKR